MMTKTPTPIPNPEHPKPRSLSLGRGQGEGRWLHRNKMPTEKPAFQGEAALCCDRPLTPALSPQAGRGSMMLARMDVRRKRVEFDWHRLVRFSH